MSASVPRKWWVHLGWRSFDQVSKAALGGGERALNAFTLSIGFDETKQRHQPSRTLQQAVDDDADAVPEGEINDHDGDEPVVGRVECLSLLFVPVGIPAELGEPHGFNMV